MSMALTWLHLSDLHCNPTRTGWDADRLQRDLARDLAERIARDELRPDFLFFTGDAAFGHVPEKGLRIEKQFDDAAAFLEQIREVCGLGRERVFLVPGNHDVDRTRIVGEDSAWLEERRQSYDRAAVEGMIRDGAADERWRSLAARLEAYRAFLARHGYTHLLADPARLGYLHRVRLEGIEVAIAGLDSAWSCQGDDRGRLWMAGAYQIAEIERREEFRKADVRIGLVHHPLSWLVEAEATELEPLFDRVFDFHLHGHEHQSWVVPVTGGAVRVAAGAAYDRSDRPNGYNLVRLDFESGKGEVWLRYYEKDSGFWQKRELRGKTDAQGVWHLEGLRCFERRLEVIPGRAARPTSEEALLDGVFDALRRNPILMLLAQDDRAEREVLAAIRERAEGVRGPAGTFHVTPSAASEASSAEYFARLGRQCRFAAEIASPTQWEDELDGRLSGGEQIFLLVSGFEKGSGKGRRELGSVLRSLSERHGQDLWVVLSGGERLAALKYEQGGLSVLNAAERLDWPEPTVEDVLVWQSRYFPGLSVGRGEAEEVLELCGGHPRLVRRCFERRWREEAWGDREALMEYGEVWKLFTRHDAEAQRRISGWLDREEVGPARPWLGDRLLRRLYWSNALRVRGRKLSWRCEVVREVGRRALGCG